MSASAGRGGTGEGGEERALCEVVERGRGYEGKEEDGGESKAVKLICLSRHENKEKDPGRTEGSKKTVEEGKVERVCAAGIGSGREKRGCSSPLKKPKNPE